MAGKKIEWVKNSLDHVGLLEEWIERPLLMLLVQDSKPTLYDTASSLRSPRGSLGSLAHRRISELKVGGGVTHKLEKGL